MQELFKIQQELNAPKGQYNSFGKYKYRSCEDILAAVKPLLAETSTTLNLTDEIVSVGNRIYVKATATLSTLDGKHSVSTTAYAREDETKKGMDGSQITGASSSYARKYALNGLFAIDDTKDADATNTHGKEAQSTPNPTDFLNQALAQLNTLTDASQIGGFWDSWKQAAPSLCTNGSTLYLAVAEKNKQLQAKTA